jgi:hypothetical protein
MPGVRRRVARVHCGALVVAWILTAGCANPLGSKPLIPDAARVRIGSIDKAALESAVQGAPRMVSERGEYLVDLFWQVGCLANQRMRSRGSRSADVVCVLPGRTSHRIVVLAHLDGAAGSGGVPRYWRGTALLPFLYQALGVEEREHSFEFVAFGKSPRPSVRDYRARLASEDGAEVRAVVEILNLGPEMVGYWSSDPGLIQDFLTTNLAVGRPLRSVRSLTHPSFRRPRIPTIRFIETSGAGLPAVAAQRSGRTEADRSPARLLAVYLAYLDETLRLRADGPAPVAAHEAPLRPGSPAR